MRKHLIYARANYGSVKNPQLPISNTRGSTVSQESWGKPPKVCARVTRPFRPGGHESVKGLARETNRRYGM